jgi:hypothetical protein
MPLLTAAETHLGYDGYWQQPMRNSLPAMSYVQTAFVSLAGQIGVGVEGSNATVQGDDQWHGLSTNNLAVPPLDPYGPLTRWFDVFTRGTESCSWKASPWEPWIKLSRYNGTVGGNNGTDARVFVSVDWDKAPKAPSITVVNINITTPCRSSDKYGYPAPMVQIPVQNRRVPANFTKGFVESDGHIAIEGPHYQAIVAPAAASKSTKPRRSIDAVHEKRADSSVTYHNFANYGRTLGGVGLWPQDTSKLTVSTAPALEYNLYLFSNSSAANVTVYLSPSLNYLGDSSPLEYGIALYPAGSSQPVPTMVRPVGNTVGTGMPDGWGDAVVDNVWGHVGNYTTSSFAVNQEGTYTLRIWCLLPSVIVQKVIVNMGGVRPSNLGPPESFLVSRDRLGEYNQTSFLNQVGVIGGSSNGNQIKTGEK